MTKPSTAEKRKRHGATHGRNSSDEPEAKVVLQQPINRNDFSKTDPKREIRNRIASIRMSPSLERVLRKRANKYTNGKLSDWLLWSALEYKPQIKKRLAGS